MYTGPEGTVSTTKTPYVLAIDFNSIAIWAAAEALKPDSSETDDSIVIPETSSMATIGIRSENSGLYTNSSSSSLYSPYSARDAFINWRIRKSKW